ncbi:hypothetical protein FNV43_RR08305 [Rhamnella rubrinervis]|uniref:NADH dehydrogenase subunit 2 n=1 Tax=Rhamnella rubrinervis TaxID=2594499 RepID=A0A8K0HG91_9ROSA|nr:hypothetical protein FNV43_RR08305 [Rhamnella rubrinervis]
MFNLFLAVSPEIFIINATFILLIHGVVFSTSKKYDYPPLVSNVGWLGLLSVARLGGQRALGCGGAIIAQLPNLMRHRVRTAGNRSMGGTSNPFAAARLANRTCAGEASVGPRNGGGGARSSRPDALQPRDHQAALSLYRDRGGIAQFFLEEGWFARVTDPAINYSYLDHRQPKSSIYTRIFMRELPGGKKGR